ncbi:MAG: hypothetical protein HY822_05250, partial [Acidobacteria bacterium]|nr:hypothetical protein [Acidobacteriota bacterium]
VLSASGLGDTEPRIATGEAGAAAPKQAVRVYVGGLPASSTTTYSADRPGEFDIQLEVPAGALPGDVVSVVVNNRAANRATYRKMRDAEVSYVPLPDGVPELHAISTSDLRGTYLIVNGDHDDAGCYPGYVFDMAKKAVSKIPDCLTATNRNAVTPIVTLNESPALAALVGPPKGDVQSGVSNQVVVFQATKPEPVKATLPENASTLRTGAEGDLEAVAPGTPVRRFNVDIDTGAVEEIEAPVQPAGNFNLMAIVEKLGTDMGYALSAPQVFPPNLIMVVVGNDDEQPTQAKVALFNQQGEIQGTRDFPEGWAPLIPPRPAQAPAGGVLPNPLPGVPIPPDLAARFVPRAAMFTDPQTRNVYVLSRTADNSKHGLVFLSPAGFKAMPFPEGWFAATCAANVPVLSLELARKATLFGTRTPETQIRNPCPAQGYLVLDLNDQTLSAVRPPGAGQINVNGGFGDLNDFIFATNTDPTRRNLADTLYILDGVNLVASRVDLPAGVNSFANLQPVRSLSALFGLATTRAQGDAGLVMFDLDRGEGYLFPTPDGFATVQMLGIFEATRKLVARGMKDGGAGSQYLIYDLVTKDLIVVPNPPGVAWVGPVPAQQPQQQQPGAGQGGQPGQQQRPIQAQDINAKASVIAAICSDQDRNQAGIMTVRVP